MTDISPREQAEQALASARAASDRPSEIAALTDLGAAYVRGNEPVRAVAALEEALALVQPLGDPGREADVLGNLAMAVLGLHLHPKGIELLNRSLTLARSAGNRAEEKLALSRLGNVFLGLRNPLQAGTYYEQALAVARSIGDRLHEADLNWWLAVVNAEIGRRDQAVLRARMSVDILRAEKHAHAEWFADHMKQFESGESGAGLLGAGPADLAAMTGVIAQSTTARQTVNAANSPGVLRMAISASKSLFKFLGSGMKTVSAETHRTRLEVCSTCEHHSGARCRVCGCFTNAKAWMPHERCPLSKWT